jgi:hypothetical protein
VLNFCMYVIVAAIGGWAINHAINNGFFIGKLLVVHSPHEYVIKSAPQVEIPNFEARGQRNDAGAGLALPAQFAPICFPIGNAATGFFVLFAVIASVVGAAAALAGFQHIRAWSPESLPAAVSSGFTAWALTLLAMGYVRFDQIHWAS